MAARRGGIRVLIAAHKSYRMPEDRMYLPLHVGAEGKTDASGAPLDLGWQKDNTGDHISGKNASYCELTALYWGWKNLEADYLGLVHYRRYFMYRKKSKDPFENILTGREARAIFQKYRVIVPKKRRYYIETLYSHYAHTHYSEHLDLARDIISERCPEYGRSLELVYRRRWGYMFNMEIMERPLQDAYCEWLFPILEELEKRCRTAELSFFQGRFYGRVSEILFNVWLQEQQKQGVLKAEEIIELPCIYMEHVNRLKKGTAFLKARFFHKKYEGSF